MKPSNGLITLVEQEEGFKASSYQDVVGVYTIGFGTTRVEGRPVTEGMTCTRDEAEQWVYDEVDPVAEKITNALKVELTQNQFDALCDFAYNLGVGALLGSTLFKLVNEGDFDNAANEFAKWDHAGGKVVEGLVKRREAERQLFLQQ